MGKTELKCDIKQQTLSGLHITRNVWPTTHSLRRNVQISFRSPTHTCYFLFPVFIASKKLSAIAPTAIEADQQDEYSKYYEINLKGLIN